MTVDLLLPTPVYVGQMDNHCSYKCKRAFLDIK